MTIHADFREFLALLQHADVFVSNDSGPVHFASGYRTPTVALFGPETPVLYRPLNPKAFKMIDLTACPTVTFLFGFPISPSIVLLSSISSQIPATIPRCWMIFCL